MQMIWKSNAYESGGLRRAMRDAVPPPHGVSRAHYSAPRGRSRVKTAQPEPLTV